MFAAEENDRDVGVISPDVLYTVREVRRRLSLGEKTWKALLARGLRVTRLSTRHRFVLGEDLIDAILGGEDAA